MSENSEFNFIVEQSVFHSDIFAVIVKLMIKRLTRLCLLLLLLSLIKRMCSFNIATYNWRILLNNKTVVMLLLSHLKCMENLKRMERTRSSGIKIMSIMIKFMERLLFRDSTFFPMNTLWRMFLQRFYFMWSDWDVMSGGSANIYLIIYIIIDVDSCFWRWFASESLAVAGCLMK